MVTRLPTAMPDPGQLPQFPFVTVLVSGGHNMVLLSRGLGNHVILGSTLDDSIGETFDKTARLLGEAAPPQTSPSPVAVVGVPGGDDSCWCCLPVPGITKIPGGPHLERMATEGDDTAVPLPKPMSKSKDRALREGRDYSFAGLKSAVRQKIEKELSEEALET